MNTHETETVHEAVRQNYAAIARANMPTTPEAPTRELLRAVVLQQRHRCHHAGHEHRLRCCGTQCPSRRGEYGPLVWKPDRNRLLQPGEVVLDLGSGGGFDVFLAGPKVGPTGRVIGIDMTPDMLALARKNTATYREVTDLENVEFRLGEIEHLPVGDASVDVVISNCVLNLSPDKPQVWREIARVLKPGGRVAVSDMALLKPLPHTVASTLEALVGCIAGAPLVTDTERMMREAGLVEMTLTPKPEYLQTLGRMERPLYQTIASHLPEGTTPADYITSLDISARKTF